MERGPEGKLPELDEGLLDPPEDPDELVLVASKRSEEAGTDVMGGREGRGIRQGQMDRRNRAPTSHAFERSIGVSH